MLNLNDPTVIWASIGTVLVLLFLVWLLTRRTSVVPEPPVTPTPPEGAGEAGEAPEVVAKDGTLQVGALPEPQPRIDLLDSAVPEPVAVPVDEAAPVAPESPVELVEGLPVDSADAPVAVTVPGRACRRCGPRHRREVRGRGHPRSRADGGLWGYGLH